MSWIDRPIERARPKRPPIDPAEIERRRQALLEADRQRKRDAYGHLSANERRSLTAKKNAQRRSFMERQSRDGLERIPGNTVVLVDWHRDEHGCRARAVGCVEGDAPAG